MSHAPDLSMAHTGDILGARYILRERIGAGGMGRVFRARDEVLARDVAIKIFHTDDGGESEAPRRMSEARALAALTHPSLVTLYDARLIGEDHVYLVMELITGPSLQRRIEQDAIAPSELAGYVSDLAGALAVVHDAGIVHRDVKPSNVLLRPLHGADRSAEAVLADFGVAHLIDATRLTTPGTVIGTAAYLAPEQVRGEPPQAASDVYALGLLAIESLTRLHPFGAGSLQETLLARLSRQPEIPDTLSAAWRSLLRDMTAADTASRPSAAEVTERVRALTTRDHELTGAGATTRRSWMLPTAPVVAAPAAVSTSTAPAASAVTAASSAGSTARSSAPSPASTGRRTDAVASRRESVRRPRRRGWAWVAASAGAALVVGGHLAAFSLGAADVATSDRAPAPATDPAPATSADAGAPSPTPAASAPAADTSPTADAPSPTSPVAPGVAEPDPVVVQPVTVVSAGAGAGGTVPDDGAASGTASGGGVPGADAGESVEVGTDPVAPGRSAHAGTGRPDSPGASDDAGKGRGPGPKQK